MNKRSEDHLEKPRRFVQMVRHCSAMKSPATPCHSSTKKFGIYQLLNEPWSMVKSEDKKNSRSNVSGCAFCNAGCMYPARRSCTPCWTIPTDVRNVLHIGRITDLDLVLFYHCKRASYMSNEELVCGHERDLSFRSFLKSFYILISDDVDCTYQRSGRWPWGPWIRLSSCTPLVDVNKFFNLVFETWRRQQISSKEL